MYPLYSLDKIKEVLSNDYAFHQSKTIDEVKRILKTGEMSDNNDVPFVLEAGNLDIEITIKWNEDDKAYLEYFCCVRTDGEWESFEEIPYTVDLDVPDLEAEMFRVLDKFAEERALCFFAQNEHTRQSGQFIEGENEYDLER